MADSEYFQHVEMTNESDPTPYDATLIYQMSIAPLVQQITDICSQYRIPHAMAFQTVLNKSTSDMISMGGTFERQAPVISEIGHLCLSASRVSSTEPTEPTDDADIDDMPSVVRELIGALNGGGFKVKVVKLGGGA